MSGEWRNEWRACDLAFAWSPDLKIEGDHPSYGAAKRDGRFAGKRFTQNLDGARSGAAVDDINLRERNVREFFVVPKNRRRRREKAYIQAVVAALAI